MLGLEQIEAISERECYLITHANLKTNVQESKLKIRLKRSPIQGVINK